MFKLFERRLQRIDPSDASLLRRKDILDDQRPIDWAHVEMLKNEILNDTFLTGDIGLAYFEDKIFLVNGQHTIFAVEKANKQIEATVSKYKCETKLDVSKLFRCYDNNRVRSLKDNGRVEANALGYEWKSRTRELVITAASIQCGLNSKAGTKNKKVELLSMYKKQGDFLDKILEPHNRSKHLMRGAIVDAIFRTFNKDEEDAYVFWEGVKSGEQLNINDPEYLLRDFLLVSRMRGTGIRACDREVLYKCLSAWNNFRRKNKLKILKYSVSFPIPKAI